MRGERAEICVTALCACLLMICGCCVAFSACGGYAYAEEVEAVPVLGDGSSSTQQQTQLETQQETQTQNEPQTQNDTQQETQQETNDSSSSAVAGVTPQDMEHMEGVIQSATDAAASKVVAAIGDMPQQAGTAGVVELRREQYETLRKIMASELRTLVFAVGFLALILGALVGVALTLHWRGSRG